MGFFFLETKEVFPEQEEVTYNVGTSCQLAKDSSGLRLPKIAPANTWSSF